VHRSKRIAALALLWGCEAAPPLATPAIPGLVCFAPESLASRPLVYGVITHSDDESGDYSGLEVRFVLDSLKQLRALVREAEGGLPSTRPVDSMGYDAGKDSIWFSMRADSRSVMRYVYRPECDRLTGMAHLWVSPSSPSGSVVKADTLVRVINPPLDNP
jgi:hypothetical protein